MDNSLISMKNIKVFIKSLIIELIVTLLMLFFLALILSKTNVEEKIINPAIIIISSFSILIGGFLCSRKLNFKGIFARNNKWCFIYVDIIYNFKYI